MIPVFNPHFGEEEKIYLAECIESGRISGSGPFVEKFEKQFAQYTGALYASTVCNGGAALETACHALELGPGDEVIVPDQTIISCPLAVKRVGACPVFADVDPETWNVTVASVEKKITAKTKAIMVVHLFGLPAPMPELMSLAKKYQLKVIEDCAQAIGSRIGEQHVGTFGDVAAYSFFVNKAIAMGEGGLVLTSQEKIHQRAQLFRNLYFGQGADKFRHEEAGWNYRLTNMQAAVGLAQLERLPWILKRKTEVAQCYRALLQNEERVQLPVEMKGVTSSHWMFALISKKKTNQEVIAALAQKGIECRPFFSSLHLQKMWREDNRAVAGDFPVSDYLSQHGLYLPSGLDLDQGTQRFVVQALKDVL